MSKGGCVTKDDIRRRSLVEQRSANLGHQIGDWKTVPNEFRPEVNSYVGVCQKPGCKCRGIVQLTPAGWALGGGYLTGNRCSGS